MIKDRKSWVSTFRNIGAFILGALSLPLIPIYNLPFGGCDDAGYFSLGLQCSAWPEFLRLFLFVIVISFVSASERLVPLLALVVVCGISALGGIEGIKTGEINISSMANILNNLYLTLSGIVGGAIAYLVYRAAFLKINKIR